MSEQPRKSPEASPEVGPEVPGSRLLTMPEVADLLGVSERAARDWVKRHDLPTLGSRPVRLAETVVRVAMAVEGRDPRNPPEDPPEVFGRSPEGPGSGEPIEAAYQVAGDGQSGAVLVPLQTMVEELRGLADQLAELARRNEGLALEVGTLRERVAGHEGQLAAKDEVIAELRWRAEVVEERAREALAERAAIVAAKNQTIAALEHRADAAEGEAATLRERLAASAVAQDEAQGDRKAPEASDVPSAAPGGLRGRLGRWWRGGR